MGNLSVLHNGYNIISGLLLSKGDLFFWAKHINEKQFDWSVQKRTDNKLVLFLLVFVKQFNGINGFICSQTATVITFCERNEEKMNENPVNRVHSCSFCIKYGSSSENKAWHEWQYKKCVFRFWTVCPLKAMRDFHSILFKLNLKGQSSER